MRMIDPRTMTFDAMERDTIAAALADYAKKQRAYIAKRAGKKAAIRADIAESEACRAETLVARIRAADDSDD